MFKDRSEYLEYRRRKWASGVIAISWIMHVKMSKVKVKLKVSREEHLENFRRRARVSYCENQWTVQKPVNVNILNGIQMYRSQLK